MRFRFTMNYLTSGEEKIHYKTTIHHNHYQLTNMSDSEGEFGIFEEPQGFYEAEKEPTFVDYTLQSGLKLNLRLVGHNPLWVSFPLFNSSSTVWSCTVGPQNVSCQSFQVLVGRYCSVKYGSE